MAELIVGGDIFRSLAKSYDKSTALYNKPYSFEFKAGKKSWTTTTYMPAPNFSNVKIDYVMNLNKSGVPIGVTDIGGKYIPIPRPLADDKDEKIPGTVFCKLRYICKEARTSDMFYEQYDEFVKTGVKVPEVVKIIYDYYKRDTFLQDLNTFLPGLVYSPEEEKAEKAEKKKKGNKAEDESDKEDKAKKSEYKIVSSTTVYVAVDGYEGIEADTEYMQFCKDFVDFVNHRNQTVITDVCMIEGVETDCIQVGNSKEKLLGFLPKFPYETSAKIVSKADSRNFDGNIRYACRCKSAKESMSIGYAVYQKSLAMFSFLMLAYRRDSLLCWSESVPEHTIDLAYDFLPDIDLENTGDVEVDIVSNSILLPQLFKTFQDLINMRVAKYPFTDNDRLLIMSPIIGKGRVTFDNFDYLEGSTFRENVAHWYRYLNTMLGNHVFFPTMRNMLDAICYTVNNTTKSALVNKWRKSLVTSMYKGKPIASDIMTNVMANMRRSELGLFKPVTSFGSTPFKYVNTVAAMLRYNLSFKEGDKYMVLDTTITDRDYLFGRLLALYQYVEAKAWSNREKQNKGAAEGKSEDKKEKGTKKSVITNAQKYSTRFIQMPVSTEALLYDKLIKGHIHKLDAGVVIWFEKQRAEIYALLAEADYTNKPLGDKWLLGYTLQTSSIYSKSSDNSTDTTVDLEDWSDDKKGAENTEAALEQDVDNGEPVE